ncbi:MAG: PilZ domain-containing protein [Thermodesulfobacteriota bacterium]|nr:PilZ domain-containing protein [Thermodesulfobacteriota bacterium]
MNDNDKKLKYKRNNRRKYARVSVSLDARFVIVNTEIEQGITSAPIHAKTKSISLNGTSLVTSIVQVEGLHIASSTSGLGKNHLKMEIDLDGEPKRTIKPIGEVRWYNLTPENGELLYNVGVSFLEMSKEDREALKTFLVKRRKEDKIHFGIPRKWF